MERDGQMLLGTRCLCRSQRYALWRFANVLFGNCLRWSQSITQSTTLNATSNKIVTTIIQPKQNLKPLQIRLKYLVFSLEAPCRVQDTSTLAARFEQAMRSTMDCMLFFLCCVFKTSFPFDFSRFTGAALRGLLEVALVFGNTLNKVKSV